MHRLMSAALAAVVTASVAGAESVAPDKVAFDEYGAVAVSLSGAPGNPDEGRIIMNKGAGNCIACHQVSALAEFPFHGNVGPSLDGAADRWSESDLRGIVANAKIMFEGSVMPSFYKTSGYIRPGEGYSAKPAEMPMAPILTAQQVEDVVAFLMTLKED